MEGRGLTEMRVGKGAPLMLAILVFGVPALAQQDPLIEQREKVVASLTSQSPNKADNTKYQLCHGDKKDALCIIFPGADASNFAQKVYSDEKFAKDMANVGFVGVAVRNTTDNKELAQNYQMPVTEHGWMSGSKSIQDPMEYAALMLAENRKNSAERATAYQAFLRQYPHTSVVAPVLDNLLTAQMQMQDTKSGVETARHLVAISSPTDTTQLRALEYLVRTDYDEARSGQNVTQNLKESKEYSQRGLQALEQAKKPEVWTDAQFAGFKSNTGSFFQSILTNLTQYEATSAAKTSPQQPILSACAAWIAKWHEPNDPPCHGEEGYQTMMAALASAKQEIAGIKAEDCCANKIQAEAYCKLWAADREHMKPQFGHGGNYYNGKPNYCPDLLLDLRWVSRVTQQEVQTSQQEIKEQNARDQMRNAELAEQARREQAAYDAQSAKDLAEARRAVARVGIQVGQPQERVKNLLSAGGFEMPWLCGGELLSGEWIAACRARKGKSSVLVIFSIYRRVRLIDADTQISNIVTEKTDKLLEIRYE